MTNDVAASADRPPSVDVLARSMASSGLPHPLLVELARTLVAQRRWHAADAEATRLARTLLQPVVNATGVLLHTNLGRAPLAFASDGHAANLEFDLLTGRRGDRQAHVGALVAQLCGAEAAIVVNNNAAAVMLVLAALARGREVLVSRGESVEIGGNFRVPDVMEQSGAVLRDVGTTNRTRLADYAAAVGTSTAMALKIHPSNFRVDGFVEETSAAELATLPVPTVADIGSGLVDAACPWLASGPPAWLQDEPAARQTLADGAALVTFSTDKLFGGPQGGIIAGRADLVRACAKHPLMRALRPGGLVLAALQDVALSYLRRTAADELPFWRMVDIPIDILRARATAIAQSVGPHVVVTDTEALPGAGSLPGVSMPSVAVAIAGDHLDGLRAAPTPVIARVRERHTYLDLRTVAPADDGVVVDALLALPR